MSGKNLQMIKSVFLSAALCKCKVTAKGQEGELPWTLRTNEGLNSGSNSTARGERRDLSMP